MVRNKQSPYLILSLGLSIFAISVCLQYFSGILAPVLRYDREAIFAGEIWRLLTGNFIHLGWNHLGLNLGTISLIGFLYAKFFRVSSLALVFIFSCLGVCAGLLLFSPEIKWYMGLSGSLYGLLIFGSVITIRQEPIINTFILLVIVSKLIFEQLVHPLSSSEFIGGTVIVDAHLYGAIMGLFLTLVYFSWPARASAR